MPRVPEYGAAPRVTPGGGPRSLPGGVPGPYQSSSMSTGMMAEGARAADQLGRGLTNLGQELARQQIDEQIQANQVRVNDAMNKAVSAKLRLTYDKDAGYTGVRGESALNRPDGKPLDQEYGEKLDQELAAIRDALGNDAQRRAFNDQASQMSVQFRGNLQQHVAKEFNDYQLSVQDGTIATAQQQMGLAWDDPKAVAQSKDAIKAAVYEAGRLRGWSAQQVEAATVDQLSRGHTSVLAAAADGKRLDYAREYLKQHGAEMTPEARLAAQKVLDVGDFEAKTQDAAGRIYANSKGDTAAALAEVREKYSGKEEDAIVTRIKTMDAERVALRERAQGDAADQAWKIYSSTGSLSKIPPSVIASMDGKALEGLRRTARADADAAAAKKEVKTDPAVYYALALAAGGDPRFKEQDLRPFFDKLSPGDRKHFIDLQAATAKPEKAAEVVGIGEQKSAMVKALGLKAEQAGTFHQVADKALFAAQQEKGKPLNQDERQKVLDRLALQGEVLTGKWYQNDPNMRMFEAMASGQAAQFKAEFSDADKRKAVAALQRQGIKNPTATQINAVLQTAYGVK